MPDFSLPPGGGGGGRGGRSLRSPRPGAPARGEAVHGGGVGVICTCTRATMRVKTFLAENFAILLVCALGLVAIYALLPRPRRLPVLLGVSAGVLALVLAAFLVVRVGKLSFETFLFYLFSAVAIIAGALLVTQQNPARAALSFAMVVLATCGLFLLQAAPFVMAATIIIYAGAIIVIFLFVLMLAQQQGLSDADARSREPLLSAVAGFFLLGAVLSLLR